MSSRAKVQIMLGHGDGSFPVGHVLSLATLTKHWNVTTTELLAGTDLREEALMDGAVRVPAATMIDLAERARNLTGEGAIGYFLGLQLCSSSRGYLELCALTCTTLRDTILLMVQFLPNYSDFCEITFQEEGQFGFLDVRERVDLGGARDILVIALIVQLWQFGNALTGRELMGSAEFAFGEPFYYADLSRRTSLPPVQFDRPSNRMVFDRTLLDLHVHLTNPTTLQQALERCDQGLKAHGFDISITERARSLLRTTSSVDELARQLSMSPRTLKRRLAAEGVAYSTLLAEHRRDEALALLRNEEHSLQEVARRLGYSDVANFARAFRRWTGVSPGTYRRQAR